MRAGIRCWNSMVCSWPALPPPFLLHCEIKRKNSQCQSVSTRHHETVSVWLNFPVLDCVGHRLRAGCTPMSRTQCDQICAICIRNAVALVSLRSAGCLPP
eukprot:1797225-Rhodomonas_salina.2